MEVILKALAMILYFKSFRRARDKKRKKNARDFKGTSYDFIFQMSLFQHLLIF